jgi:hypothetical protein
LIMSERQTDTTLRLVNKTLLRGSILHECEALLAQHVEPTADNLGELAAVVEACVLHSNVIVFHDHGAEVFPEHLPTFGEFGRFLADSNIATDDDVFDLFNARFGQNDPKKVAQFEAEADNAVRELDALLDDPREAKRIARGTSKWFRQTSNQRPDKRDAPEDFGLGELGVPPLDEFATSLGLSFVETPAETVTALENRIQRTVSESVYRNLADIYAVNVSRLMRFAGIRQAYIPPLFAIVLQNSAHPGDIPAQIRYLRNELASFRAECATMQRSLVMAETLGEKLDVLEALDETQGKLVNLLERKHTRFIHQTWNVVKKGSVTGMVAESMDKLIQKDDEHQIRSHWQSFFDIWRAALSVREHDLLIQKVFGRSIPTAGRSTLQRVCAATPTLEGKARGRTIERG